MTDTRSVLRGDTSTSLTSPSGHGSLLRLTSGFALLLLPASVSFVHAVIKRKGDAARGGHTAPQEGPLNRRAKQSPSGGGAARVVSNCSPGVVSNY